MDELISRKELLLKLGQRLNEEDGKELCNKAMIVAMLEILLAPTVCIARKENDNGQTN